jgi:hypothetical protein
LRPETCQMMEATPLGDEGGARPLSERADLLRCKGQQAPQDLNGGH